MYYVKVMKKVLERGVEYIQTEHERLGRILSELSVDTYVHYVQWNKDTPELRTPL